mgnify:CR=1 FL=1
MKSPQENNKIECCEKCLKCPDYSEHNFCHDKSCPCHTKPTENKCKCGHIAPDYVKLEKGMELFCPDEIKVETLNFLRTCLNEQHEKLNREWGERVEKIRSKQKYSTGLTDTMFGAGYNQAISDALQILTQK